MNKLTLNDNIKIEDMIYEIRGVQVMLSSDVAKLYHVETKVLNQTIKRNINRFPDLFCFQLTNEEIDELSLRSQFVTLNKSNNLRGQHYKYLPYALTEQGIMMLSGLLKSDIAVKVNIEIIDAFVAMRHYIGNNEFRISNIETKIIEHDNSIKMLQESFEKLERNKEVNEIYFDGKIYDAYSKILDIFNEAKEELIIIDRYTDKTILDMVKNLKCKVILITSKNTKLNKLDIDKYNNTYNNLTIYYDDTYHDRYFIIDKNKIYHSGNSINHIGYRKSSINVLEDKVIKDKIIEEIKKIIKK